MAGAAGQGGGIVLGGQGGVAGGAGAGGFPGGAAGAGASSGVAGGAGRSSRCAGSAELSGSWDGSSYLRSYQVSAKSVHESGFWLFFEHLDADGFLALRGDGESPRRQGIERLASATLLTPSAGPDPLAWYCSNQATFTDDDVEARVNIAGLGRLGTCAGGEPVAGEITVCDDNATGCSFTRSGSLDGTTVTSADWDSYGGTYLQDVSVAYPDGMIIRFFRENHFESSGALTNAFVITPPGPPFEGRIYCAGAGSMHSGALGEPQIHLLTNFTRVGSCGGVTGSNTASGCVEGH